MSSLRLWSIQLGGGTHIHTSSIDGFKVSPIEINQLQLEIVIHELEGTLTIGILPFSYIPHSCTMRMTRWCIISPCSPFCLYRKIDSAIIKYNPKKKKKKKKKNGLGVPNQILPKRSIKTSLKCYFLPDSIDNTLDQSLILFLIPNTQNYAWPSYKLLWLGVQLKRFDQVLRPCCEATAKLVFPVLGTAFFQVSEFY